MDGLAHVPIAWHRRNPSYDVWRFKCNPKFPKPEHVRTEAWLTPRADLLGLGTNWTCEKARRARRVKCCVDPVSEPVDQWLGAMGAPVWVLHQQWDC